MNIYLFFCGKESVLIMVELCWVWLWSPFLSVLVLSALNLRRRPWYDHLLSCPPPLPPRWTLKCLIRVNQGARATNHSPRPVTPRRLVLKGLKMLQGEWGWRTARAWTPGQVPRWKSKGREAPRWSRLSSRRVVHLPVRRKVRPAVGSTVLSDHIPILFCTFLFSLE